MHAEPADQQRLLDVADLDTQLAKLQHTAKTLPQHETIKTLVAEREQLKDNHVAATTRIDDIKLAVNRAEADLQPVRARLERDQKRVQDGTVTDGKILADLLAEIERLKSRISDLEDAQLEVMEQLEEATAELARLTERQAEVDRDLRQAVSERDGRGAELKAEAMEVAATRKKLAATIPTDLSELYERLRAHSGLGAAKLHRGRCGGCQLELTLADMDAIRKAAPVEIVRCPECDRILVRTSDSGL